MEDVEAPPNFSVRVADPCAPDRRRQRFHTLFVNCQPVLETRDPERLVGAMLAHLGQLPPESAPLVALDAMAVVAKDVAVVTYTPWQPRHAVEGHLRYRQLLTVDGRFLLIDPATGELVVRQPSIAVDASVVPELPGAFPGRAVAEPAAAPGRYRIVGHALPPPSVGPGAVSRARVAHWSISRLRDHGDVDAYDAMQALAALARSTGRTWIDWKHPAESLSRLTSLVDSEPATADTTAGTSIG